MISENEISFSVFLDNEFETRFFPTDKKPKINKYCTMNKNLKNDLFF
jgi:hypothetical protein